MSSNRSTGAEPDLPPFAVAAAVLWLLVGGAAAGATLRDTSQDARLLVASATAVGLGAVVAGYLTARARRSNTWMAAGLIVSGLVTPTTFAYATNLLPVVVGGWLLLRRVGRCRGRVAPRCGRLSRALPRARRLGGGAGTIAAGRDWR